MAGGGEAKRLHGSGGYVEATLTDEEVKKADLGVGKLFLAPVGKVAPGRITAHHCNECDAGFEGPPRVNVEESPNEEVADNLVLVERGQYACKSCGSAIGEYREFRKKDESAGIGEARPDNR